MKEVVHHQAREVTAQVWWRKIWESLLQKSCFSVGCYSMVLFTLVPESGKKDKNSGENVIAERTRPQERKVRYPTHEGLGFSMGETLCLEKRTGSFHWPKMPLKI